PRAVLAEEAVQVALAATAIHGPDNDALEPLAARGPGSLAGHLASAVIDDLDLHRLRPRQRGAGGRLALHQGRDHAALRTGHQQLPAANADDLGIAVLDDVVGAPRVHPAAHRAGAVRTPLEGAADTADQAPPPAVAAVPGHGAAERLPQLGGQQLGGHALQHVGEALGDAV